MYRYSCIQFCIGSESLYTFITLIETEEHNYLALEITMPKWIYSYNRGKETGSHWISILHKFCISGPHMFEPYCPHQNQEEHQIQDVEHLLCYMMKHSQCPSKGWCYAAMLVIEILNNMVQLHWQQYPMYAALWCYGWYLCIYYQLWQPIKYLEPKVSFPENMMLPGRWLGILKSTGDEFTCSIIPVLTV